MADLPNIERIIERQARSWEIRRQLAGEGGQAAREALAHLREGPWVSVSRQSGSGGLDLAGALGCELGWQVFDREILAAIAKSTNSRGTILSGLDEQAVGPIRDYLSSFVMPGTLGQIAFLEELSQVILGLAKKGSAIIVGRGANWFLDPRYGLRVRVVAPLEVRVARLVEEEGLGADEVRERIREHETRRKEYIRKVFGRDIDDPLGYDLVLNTESLSVETATRVVLAALRQKLD